MIAVWSARFAKCRSMQLAQTFRTPSSYHRMCRFFASYETSLTFEYGLIHSSRVPVLAPER